MYLISSLYFEAPTDRVLEEKLIGVRNREEIRFRLI